MKIYTQEEVLDLTLGKRGTPAREKYESMVEKYLKDLAKRRSKEIGTID